jgi:serine/threonine-protein kinase ATR
MQAKVDALATFMKLLSHEPFLNSQRLRVSAMVSVRRLIVHIDNHGVYALESSDIGQWCLQSLTSSIRELRIAAG